MPTIDPSCTPLWFAYHLIKAYNSHTITLFVCINRKIVTGETVIDPNTHDSHSTPIYIHIIFTMEKMPVY